jgi:DNA-binding response OmpR family regulator
MLTRYGQRAQLTQKDFELAAFLLRHSGSLVSREQIYAKVWPGREGRITRTLDTHIARIRDKLRLRPEQGWELTSVYGHGYRLARVANRGRIAA